MVVPIWKPFLDLGASERVIRGIIYFLAIAYLFLGVSIVADRFMSSIEVIEENKKGCF
jgi:solute carrier family 8 (sodium/calcium exchanger)